jgi:energy-coupling factor transporter ATP-binding protein EcfA2
VPPVISVRDLRKSYADVAAVDGVSFDVDEGEFFGILGPNGAGKTTTLEIIEGLREPDSGHVTVLGLAAWPLKASGATFGAAITLVSWRQNKLLRRLRLAPIGTASIGAARIGIALAIGLIQLAVFLAIANLIILPMAFVGGAFIPLDFAPDWVRRASYAIPLRYLVTAMQDVMARGEGPSAALPAIGILLGFTLVAGLAAIRLFRWDDI